MKLTARIPCLLALLLVLPLQSTRAATLLLSYAAWQSSQRTHLAELIEAHAPQLRFHENEKYYLSSVPHFLNYTKDVGHGLELRDRSPASVSGDLSTAEVYVHVVQLGPVTALQYWFFYSFNGPGTAYYKVNAVAKWESLGDHTLEPCGQHEGDWEHVTFIVDSKTGQLKSAWLAQHDSGEFIKDATRLRRTVDGQVKLFPSKFGHATYKDNNRNGGRHYSQHHKVLDAFEVYMLNSTGGGQRFNTRGRWKLIAVDRQTSEGDFYNVNGHYGVQTPDWFRYTGRWGARVTRPPAAVLRALKDSVPSEILDFSGIEALLKEIGIWDECEFESGPEPPFQKSNWNTAN